MTDFFEHIGDYKAGKLTGDLLKSFEAELLSDVELKAAVENHDVVEEVFELMFEDEIRRVMVMNDNVNVNVNDNVNINDIGNINVNESQDQNDEENENGNLTKTTDKIRRLSMWRSLAASVLVLIVGIFGLKMYTQYEYGHDQLIAQYYEKPKNPDAVKSAAPDIKDDIIQAKYIFDLNRFEDSKEAFKILEKKDLSNEQKDIINFYLGNIALIQNDVQNGIKYFRKTNDDRKYAYLAQLYFLERNTSALEELHSSNPTTVSTKLLAKTKRFLFKFF